MKCQEEIEEYMDLIGDHDLECIQGPWGKSNLWGCECGVYG